MSTGIFREIIDADGRRVVELTEAELAALTAKAPPRPPETPDRRLAEIEAELVRLRAGR